MPTKKKTDTAIAPAAKLKADASDEKPAMKSAAKIAPAKKTATNVKTVNNTTVHF